MKILVLGGTQFVGRHIVEALLQGQHAVSILTRGVTPDPLPASVQRLRGDRNAGPAGLNCLEGGTWDVAVDVSGFTARQVRASATQLRNAVGHYVFISAVSVHGDPSTGPVTEEHARMSPAAEDVEEIDSKTYGPLKVTCENIVTEIYGARCALLRPQIVAGPHDPYDRFSYWVRRAGEGGEMLAPGNGGDMVQFIGAADVAAFTRLVCERALAGSFNLSGARMSWMEFLSALGARNLVWVPADVLKRAGITEFELPLFRPNGGPRSNLMHVGHERARQAGLVLSDVRKVAEAVRAWLPCCALTPALAPEREAELIRFAREAGAIP